MNFKTAKCKKVIRRLSPADARQMSTNVAAAAAAGSAIRMHGGNTSKRPLRFFLALRSIRPKRPQRRYTAAMMPMQRAWGQRAGTVLPPFASVLHVVGGRF